MNALDFKEISTRGRVAYSICCLEEALKCQNIKVVDDSEKVILQQLWHFTSDNMALWENQIKEIIPYVVSEEVDYETKDYTFFSLKFHNKIQSYYKKCNIHILKIIDLIYDIGTTNMFVTIKNEQLKEASLPLLQELIDIMIQNHIPLPLFERFMKFSVRENNGWGNEFTREYIFKEV